jgi:phosphoribosylformylglycinamidine synthase subunit PurL
MGLNDEEYGRILRLLDREPSLTELGMFAVMWSEHCGYKYSRPILALFKRYKEALEGKGFENAGVVEIGEGLGVTMKVESHNHPSAVEPYQGAATGVGGIIRDILTMGARPVALLNSLRFGPVRDGDAPPEVVDRNRYLFEQVVAGIAGYGNCVGVPTVAGEVNFHPRYSGNPLVNAMCVGILELENLTTAAAEGQGNPVLYLGSATGKDGIHGATFASDTLGEDSDAKRPNVQIGDPFAEKLLIEATLEALATGAVVAIQDMGAAGLTCSTVEMASKGGVGMRIDLDRVPMRESDMSGYELMLSESQERMLAVVQRGREQEVLDVFRKWGLRAEVIGEVTPGERLEVVREGQVVASLDPRLLTDECPTYRTEPEVPAYHLKAADFRPDRLPQVEPLEALPRLLASHDLASKRWVFEQYDQQVLTQTVLAFGEGDAAVIAPRGTDKGIAVKIDGNARYTYLHPYRGGMLAVAEAARNVACTGARPKAVTDGLNFGNPQLPHVYWQFSEAVRGIAEAAEALGTPVISGNVSFYNESELGEVPPTPLIGMMGLLEHAERRVGIAPPIGTQIVRIRVPIEVSAQEGLGASAYAAELGNTEDGFPETPDLDGERRLAEALASGVETGLILAAHDVSDGGAAVALAEMAIAGDAGLAVELPEEGRSLTSMLFGELPGTVFVATRAAEAVVELARRYGLEGDRVGATTEEKALRIAASSDRSLEWPVTELRDAYEQAIPRAMHRDSRDASYTVENGGRE